MIQWPNRRKGWCNYTFYISSSPLIRKAWAWQPDSCKSLCIKLNPTWENVINVEVPSTKSGRVDVYTIFVWLTAEYTHTHTKSQSPLFSLSNRYGLQFLAFRKVSLKHTRYTQIHSYLQDGGTVHQFLFVDKIIWEQYVVTMTTANIQLTIIASISSKLFLKNQQMSGQNIEKMSSFNKRLQ